MFYKRINTIIISLSRIEIRPPLARLVVTSISRFLNTPASLLIFTLLVGTSSGLESRDVWIRNGSFSLTSDCGKFFNCFENQQPSIYDCPPGASFEASVQQCLPSQLVDCTKHSHPSVGNFDCSAKRRPTSALRVNGIPIQFEKPFLSQLKSRQNKGKGSRQKRKAMKTSANDVSVVIRPWGIWREDDYIPYLFLQQMHDGDCEWPWPEDFATTTTPTTSTTSTTTTTTPAPETTTITTTPAPETTTITTTPETTTADDKEIIDTDDEKGVAPQINFGREAGPVRQQQILKKKVHFLSDDFDAGAQGEEKIYKLIGAYDPHRIFTQAPNKVVTLGYHESAEEGTGEDGTWLVTRISKSRNRAMKAQGRGIKPKKR